MKNWIKPLIVNVILVLSICIVSNGKLWANSKGKVIGIIYKKFNENYVQIKDYSGQVFKVPRSSIPPSVKIADGEIVYFEIDPQLIKFKPKKKRKGKRR